MIDEYERNYFLLSCDLCGITEEGPFATFKEAVRYKKDNPDEWKSLFLKNDYNGKQEWHDVCAGCFPKTVMANWKYIPTSKRTRPLKTEKASEEITSMANQIARAINKRRREL